MANCHDEYVYQCETCHAIMCSIDHDNGRVIFWYIMQELPDWARDGALENSFD